MPERIENPRERLERLGREAHPERYIDVANRVTVECGHTGLRTLVDELGTTRCADCGAILPGGHGV